MKPVSHNQDSLSRYYCNTTLVEYFGLFQLGQLGDPFGKDLRFWNAPNELRFAAALPVLAARSLAVFTRSDNITWLKHGGLQREHDVSSAIARALAEWRAYAETIATKCSLDGKVASKLHVSWMDAECGYFGEELPPTAIVTSPPYANRLDYTRMWAPELEVASAMFQSVEAKRIQERQLGTNTVRGKLLPKKEETLLPAPVRVALDEIRKDQGRKAAESYYYPFFLNYAVSLAQTLRHLGSFVADGGMIVVFVRDTVTKDVLFPTGKLVEDTLCSMPGIQKIREERKIIRQHVGLRRRNREASLYGLAQQEWWLAFQKERQ